MCGLLLIALISQRNHRKSVRVLLYTAHSGREHTVRVGATKESVVGLLVYNVSNSDNFLLAFECDAWHVNSNGRTRESLHGAIDNLLGSGDNGLVKCSFAYFACTIWLRQTSEWLMTVVEPNLSSLYTVATEDICPSEGICNEHAADCVRHQAKSLSLAS